MTYRILQTTEWDQLKPEFDLRHVPMPDPAFARIYAAFDDAGGMLAFLVCQFKLHSEPLVSYSPPAVPGLLAFAENSLMELGFNGIECYIGSSNERVRELAWILGFRPTEPMFVKRLGGSGSGSGGGSGSKEGTGDAKS